jgi:deoxyribose-phosphate aldolase
MKDLLSCIEHTLLKPDAVWADIKRICDEALEYGFGAVCVNGCHVQRTAEYLKNTPVKTVTVAGFPLGTQGTKVKAYEAALLVEQGADEVDIVINVGALKDQDYDYVVNDIKCVADAVKGKALLKVILETCLLTDEQVVKACELCEKAGADFVKTSTGFNGPGATVSHVRLMKQTVGDRLRVKAAGGIRTLQQAKDMIEAGADRIGCSASVAIAKELLK